MSRIRVVITGIGVVSPIGNDLASFWNGILEGRNGVGPITRFDASEFRTRFAMEVKDFDPEIRVDRKTLRLLDRFAQFAVVAAGEAMEDSGLDPSGDPTRYGVITGSGIGGLGEIELQHAKFIERGPSRISPYFVPKMMMNAASGHIAIQHGLKGSNFATVSACASSQHALGVALGTIRAGRCDAVLAGGSEAAITVLGVGGFCSLKAMSSRNDDFTTAMRPFQASRDGFVMGEGGAIFVFEELEHARKRGAQIYCEVLGFGSTDDAHHITAPDPDAPMAVAAMRSALEYAGKNIEQVDYINAHGTSTPLNDKMEVRAIRELFGDHADHLMVSSTKSQVGHLLGASGAVELAAIAVGIRDSVVPATINQVDPDPECDLDSVPNEPREAPIRVALSNSFGFGGHDACLCLGKFED
ncbi:MAG: beta-ketoacyl-ACP synthase II [Planctomycetota bacterium]|nr:beta-ketoacyl-ACP synthase II [Planctomycetota bacterium]